MMLTLTATNGMDSTVFWAFMKCRVAITVHIIIALRTVNIACTIAALPSALSRTRENLIEM
ncbi:hypothetical protein DZ860_00675 [Vibrio sinensis]|uniref:Uncharacterized protein n=1 Tax=Vibrio sinensis TaxID=2302434 RepID=A0A3A6R1P9_9VIBR|nr:hypothetical protein DZ860_00675 [Vibrio sinensis]